MSKVIFKNGEVFYQGVIQKKDVCIENECIIEIADSIEDAQAECIDITNQILTLGFVDMHVHLREPGYEHKETIASGTRSAKYGGYTHLVAMANTNPCMDSIEAIADFKKRVHSDAKIHTYTYSAITKQLQGKELVDFDSISKEPIVLGFSDDGKGVQQESMMAAAMQKAKENQAMIVAHCEDEEELVAGGSIHAGVYAKEHNLIGINNASEYKQAKRDLRLAKEYRCRYHICHISTKETVAALKEAKEQGVLASGEACPHHLILTDENIKDCHPNYKMNPPLRSKEDVEALLTGLREGTIQVIATDHAPHSQEEKMQSMTKAPFGIIGNQHAFSLLYTYLVKKGLLSLETLLTCMSENPARILGLDHHFAIGKKANLCVLDITKEFTITKESIKSKSINTPFLGVTCTGQVTYHVLDGKVTKL